MNAIARTFAIVILLLPLTACAISGDALDGKVLDESTNKPVPGAIVVVRWQGLSAGSYVDTHSICYHVETATTDEQGRFHINAWQTTEEAIGLHSTWYQRLIMGPTIHDQTVMKDAYKPGYVFGTKPTEEKIVWMVPFKGTSGERLEYLKRIFGSTGCGAPEENKKKFIPFLKALYDEAKLHGGDKKPAPNEMSLLESIRYDIEKIELGFEEAEKRHLQRP